MLPVRITDCDSVTGEGSLIHVNHHLIVLHEYSTHGYHFISFVRITYVDEWTIRLTGQVIPNGKSRTGHPFNSQYNERKKARKNSSHVDPWSEKFIASGLSKGELEQLAEDAKAPLKEQESQIKPIRKDVGEKRTVQSQLSRQVRSGESVYPALHAARASLRDAERSLIPLEDALREQRQIVYNLNKTAKAAGNSKNQSKKGTKTSTSFTTPTWERLAMEDEC